MRELESKKRFGVTIRELRRKRGFSQERVSAGLCTAQELSYFEKGEREVPKLLQDALQERLGLGTEDYEHYLDYSEYEHWEARQRILHCITWEETDRAEALLEQYRISHAGCSGGCRNVKERLERQFYLSMLAQIWSCKGAERKEIHILLEEAVQLTVPALWKEPVGEMTLSIKELNLILEAEHYREGGGEEEHYREILTCIDSSGLDGIGMAKIYDSQISDALNIDTIGELEDVRIFIFNRSQEADGGATEAALLTPTPLDECPVQEVVTIGTVRPSTNLLNSVADFNRQNEDFNVSILNYSIGGKTYNEAREALKLDISLGKGPDICTVDWLGDTESLIAKGCFTDLSGYLDGSGMFKREDFISQALDIYSDEGQLMAIPK